MNCPACHGTLESFAFGGETIDRCPDCDGIWFDAGELAPVTEEWIRQGRVSAADIRSAYRPIVRGPVQEAERMCPCCATVMPVFNYAYDSNVFLNKCPTCDGVWTDAGELDGVARYLKGHPAVNRYAASLTQSIEIKRRRARYTNWIYSKPLSGGVALLYIVLSLSTRDASIIFRTGMFVILPLACIWFARQMGGYRGLLSLPRPAITQPSHPFFVALAGWLVLLIPILSTIYQWIVQ